MKAKLGETVGYCFNKKEDLIVGIITKVHEDGTVDLNLFKSKACFVCDRIPYSKEPKEGCWTELNKEKS